MRNIFLGFVLACVISNVDAFAQNPNWLWAKSAIGTGNEYGNDLSTDASGNIYLTGDFSSSLVTFGSTTLANTAGSSDFFVTKYNSSGNVIWARSAIGTSLDVGRGVCSDPLGNVYVIGDFKSPTLSFGTVTLTNSSNNFTSDVFIAKYDSTGILMWAISVGSSNNESGTDIASDTQGNIYITGSFSSNSILLGSHLLFNFNNGNLFLAKLDPSGNVQWAKSSNGYSVGNKVKVDNNGNVYITGNFSSSPLTIGSVSITFNTPINFQADLFLFKFNSSGNAVWGKSVGGQNGDAGTDLALNAAGEIYLTGFSNSPFINIGTTTLTGLGSGRNAFLAKFDTSGSVLWANGVYGFMWDVISVGISLDSSNNAYVAGWFDSNTISFGTTTYSNNWGTKTTFIANYNPSGNFSWAHIIDANGINLAGNITIDPAGNAYLVGSFQSNLLTFGNSTLSNSGNSDVFLSKFNGYSSVGLNEFNKRDLETVIFPNPFSKESILQLNENVNNATLSIRNNLGQTIKEIKNISGQKVAIFRDDLPEGIYYFNLYQGPKTIGKGKFVITNH